jgi:protein-tyrosine phosphatase
MIDLHCHLLPGLDDGATSLEAALAMARLAEQDGVEVTACTPHILPGLYENTGPAISVAVGKLAAELARAGIRLRLVTGADIHITHDLVAGLRSGRLPTLNGSRYFLLEPPHHVAPPRFEETVFSALAAGFVPIITHPERLSWLEAHYGVFRRLARSGVWMQLTAGSLLGRFGGRARHWSDRLLRDGLVHILASDGHDVEGRRPILANARKLAARRVGDDEATHLVATRPQMILDDADPARAPRPDFEHTPASEGRRLFSRLLGVR